MTAHQYHLRALETRIWGVPNLFLKPVWAHCETLDEALSIPYGTEHYGLADIALHARVDALTDRITFDLVSTAYMPTLQQLNGVQREMKATAAAMAELQQRAGSRLPTIGERCQAWCDTYDMPGVLLPRSPGDECARIRLCRNVRSAVDHYLAEWEERAREESMPIALQVEAMAEAAVGN